MERGPRCLLSENCQLQLDRCTPQVILFFPNIELIHQQVYQLYVYPESLLHPHSYWTSQSYHHLSPGLTGTIFQISVAISIAFPLPAMLRAATRVTIEKPNQFMSLLCWKPELLYYDEIPSSWQWPQPLSTLPPSPYLPPTSIFPMLLQPQESPCWPLHTMFISDLQPSHFTLDCSSPRFVHG